MITKKTVFILGAGASVDSGYPIGEELRKFIYTNCMGKNSFVKNIAKFFVYCESDIPSYEDIVVSFARNLYLDGADTIDAFLERRLEDYLIVGKLAIAQAIAHHENRDKLWDVDNWYHVLYNKMKQGATLETFEQNEVSFVTFNYDRSLEHFLFTSLPASYGNPPKEKVKNIIENIPIIHLYGQIGELPWQRTDGKGRPYGEKITALHIREYGKNIGIIYEKFQGNIQSKFNEARQLIDEAERVYILGFGFHKDNLERLQIEKFKDKKIIGTGIGLDNDQIMTISNYWGDGKKSDAKGFDSLFFKGLTLHDMQAYRFVKELAELD